MPSIYDYTVKLANGEERSMSEYRDSVLIIVNTASKCGFTPQFKGLQELYEKYKDIGLVVLGFPCDQFNNQEYEDINETTQFCQDNYGVTFPIFEKIYVNGPDAHPLFVFLREQQKGILSDKIKWNFTKFLVDQHGHVFSRYAPTTDPAKIESDLLKLI